MESGLKHAGHTKSRGVHPLKLNSVCKGLGKRNKLASRVKIFPGIGTERATALKSE